MKRIFKILLIIFGVIIVIYGIYLAFGRPAIPLPAYRYKVYPGNQLYDIIKATGSDEVKVTLVSNGEIVAQANDKELVRISFTPESLDNAASIAAKYALPTDIQNTLSKINDFLPKMNYFPNFVNFFYHIIRFRLTFIIAAI